MLLAPWRAAVRHGPLVPSAAVPSPLFSGVFLCRVYSVRRGFSCALLRRPPGGGGGRLDRRVSSLALTYGVKPPGRVRRAVPSAPGLIHGSDAPVPTLGWCGVHC